MWLVLTTYFVINVSRFKIRQRYFNCKIYLRIFFTFNKRELYPQNVRAIHVMFYYGDVSINLKVDVFVMFIVDLT